MWSSFSVAVQLRLRGYKRTRETLERIQPRRREPPVALHQISQVTNGVLRRVPWSPNCLEQSLVLIRVLRRSHRGEEPVLRLGVRRCGDTLEFHAWVEANGKVVGENENIAQSFRPFGGEQFPPRATFV